MITYTGTFWIYAWRLDKDGNKDEVFLDYQGTAITDGGDWSFVGAKLHSEGGYDLTNGFRPDWTTSGTICLDSGCYVAVPKNMPIEQSCETERKLERLISILKNGWKMPDDSTYDDLYARISNLDILSHMFELKNLFERYFPLNPQHLRDKNGDDPKHVFDPSKGYSNDRKLRVLHQYEGENQDDAWRMATTDSDPEIRHRAYERLNNIEGLVATIEQVEDAGLARELFERFLDYGENKNDQLNNKKVQQFLANTALSSPYEWSRVRAARILSPDYPDIFLETLNKSCDAKVLAMLERRMIEVPNSLRFIMGFPEPLLDQEGELLQLSPLEGLIKELVPRLVEIQS